MQESIDELSPLERWWVLLHYAVMAPSGHNTQPWRFRLQGPVAELSVDRERWLPIVDPHGRELVISCGAALANLRIAVNHHGLQERTQLLPRPDLPDLLARVELLDGRAEEPSADAALFGAMPERRTNRFPYEPVPVPDELIAELESEAQKEGAWLVMLRSAADRKRAAALIAEGDRIQAADRELRREMAQWVRSNSSPRRDGLRGYSFGHGRLASLLAPFYVRYANWGDNQAHADEELAASGPVLAILGTDGDRTAEWLRAGQALSRVLLRSQVEGFSASYFNQPIEVPELRPKLAALAGASGYPQMCFRLGKGRDVLPSSRRPVDDVVVDASE